MPELHVYDKAKYHDENIHQYGLSEEHAENHTVFFLRWLIENDLVSEIFQSEGGGVIDRYRAGAATIHGVYEWFDRCLVSDMLSEEGNAFAMSYFDFDEGAYIGDYIKTLQGNLPSEFHVHYTEENYQKMRRVIDRRYRGWKMPKRSWWRR